MFLLLLAAPPGGTLWSIATTDDVENLRSCCLACGHSSGLGPGVSTWEQTESDRDEDFSGTCCIMGGTAARRTGLVGLAIGWGSVGVEGIWPVTQYVFMFPFPYNNIIVEVEVKSVKFSTFTATEPLASNVNDEPSRNLAVASLMCTFMGYNWSM